MNANGPPDYSSAIQQQQLNQQQRPIGVPMINNNFQTNMVQQNQFQNPQNSTVNVPGNI